MPSDLVRIWEVVSQGGRFHKSGRDCRDGIGFLDASSDPDNM